MHLKKLIFATNNHHKLIEARQILGSSFGIISLDELGCYEDIPETADTLDGNALMKALYIRDHYQSDCFADDTGLEIEALGNQPGVLSARYAGPGKDFSKNIDKVLFELKDNPNRKARFRTVVALLLDGGEYFFEGIVDGVITFQRKGLMGFGYDSIFRANGYDVTFAEMTLDEKNMISHRGEAMRKLAEFLGKYKAPGQ